MNPNKLDLNSEEIAVALTLECLDKNGGYIQDLRSNWLFAVNNRLEQAYYGRASSYDDET